MKKTLTKSKLIIKKKYYNFYKIKINLISYNIFYNWKNNSICLIKYWKKRKNSFIIKIWNYIIKKFKKNIEIFNKKNIYEQYLVRVLTLKNTQGFV